LRDGDEQARELPRAHREIATLRERVAQLERILAQVRAILASRPDRKPRAIIGNTPCGEPVYGSEQ